MLKTRLLEGLSQFRLPQGPGAIPRAPGIFSYCALSRERLACVTLPYPIIAVVLSGAKEIHHAERSERLVAGTMFVLPGQTDLDIVNEPEARSGLYQSLVLEVGPKALAGFTPHLAYGSHQNDSYSIPLTNERVEATLHATRALVQGPVSATIRMARLTELLALLEDVPAARPLFDMSISERVARLIRAHLDLSWTAAHVAKRLALSESTLRRRLALEGRSFAAIMRSERMAAARRLMAQGMGSGAAALAVGYASRTHFARAFRASFGRNPTQIDRCPNP